MIIQIRGTSGSGKTHLVRRVMERYEDCQPFYHEEDFEPTLFGEDLKSNAKPLGYNCLHPNGGKDLVVIGRYDIACGGTDPVTARFSMDFIYELVKDAYEDGSDVIFEGLLCSADRKRTISAYVEQGWPILAVGLDTPLEICLSSVNDRRRERNPEAKDVNPKNTESKHKDVIRAMKRLEEHGVPNVWLDREAAYERVCEELGL